MKKLTILLCIILCMSCIPSALAEEENIALDKPVISLNYWEGYPPANVNDGDYTTEWCQGGTTYMSGKTNITIDLGQMYLINEVRVYNRTSTDQPENNARWKLYFSNTDNMSDAVLVEEKDLPAGGGQGGCWTIYPSLQAGYRYLAVTGATKDTHYGISEIEAYGTPFDPNGKVESNFLDVSGTVYDGPAKLVHNLSILSGVSSTEFSPFVLMTRYEAVKAVLSMSGNNASYGTTDVFADIPKDDSRNETVCAALKLGIISADTKFGADDYITGLEFGKMIVSAMGYGVKAEAYGGWSVGYSDVCRSLGLFSGVSGKEYSPLNRGDAAIMMYNALKNPMYETDEISDNSVKFDKSDKPMIEAIFGYTLQIGIVKEVSYASLYEKLDKTTSGRIKINNNVYYDKSGKGDDFLGLNVMALVDKDDSVIDIWTYKTNVYKAYISDIKTPVSSSQIEIEETGKKYKLGDYRVLKNGEADPSFKLSDLKFEYGYIELIDNDNDDTIDVISIMDGMPIIVENFSYDNDFMFALSKTGTVYTSSDVEDVICCCDGKSYNPSKIKSGNVITVYPNSDNTRIIIEVSGNSVITSNVTGYDTDSITTDDGILELSDWYVKNTKNEDKQLKLGEKYSIYTDNRGEVVYLDSERAFSNVLFIQKIGKTSGIGSALEMRCFTDKGIFETVTLAENVTIDGIKCSVGSLETKLGNINNYLLHKFAFYEKNSKGEISVLDVEKDSSETSVNHNMIKLDYQVAKNDELFVNDGFYYFSKLVQPCHSDTPIFIIPMSSNREVMTDKIYDNYYKISNTITEFPYLQILANLSTVTTGFYSPDSNNYPLFGVKYKHVSTVSQATKHPISGSGAAAMILKNVLPALDTDGEKSFKAIGYNIKSGKEVEVIISDTLTYAYDSYKIQQDGLTSYLSSDTYLTYSSFTDEAYITKISDLKCGDVIRYGTSGGEMSELDRVFSIDDGSLDYTASNGRFYGTSGSYPTYATATFMLRYGYLKSVNDGVGVLSGGSGTNDTLFKISDIKQLKRVKDGKISDMNKNEISAYVNDKDCRILLYYASGSLLSAVMYCY